jgi:cell wall-associated NlpC family hydrolase
VTGADVVTAARLWLGVRYRHQGRSREGVDCIGLPVCVRADLGLPAFDAEPGYAPTSMSTAMLDYCKGNMVEVSRDDLQPGDILVQMSGAVRHMAIVCDYPLCKDSLGIIHAWISNRRVCECRLDATFMQTVRGCFRFPEVTA